MTASTIDPKTTQTRIGVFARHRSRRICHCEPRMPSTDRLYFSWVNECLRPRHQSAANVRGRRASRPR
jgi:hypothetical protein